MSTLTRSNTQQKSETPAKALDGCEGFVQIERNELMTTTIPQEATGMRNVDPERPSPMAEGMVRMLSQIDTPQLAHIAAEVTVELGRRDYAGKGYENEPSWGEMFNWNDDRREDGTRFAPGIRVEASGVEKYVFEIDAAWCATEGTTIGVECKAITPVEAAQVAAAIIRTLAEVQS